MGVRTILKAVVPPVIVSLARGLRSARPPRKNFVGPYPSWEAAAADANGWDDPSITVKFLDSALKVRDGKAAFDQDGKVSSAITYSPVIFAALLLAVSRNREALNVIDIGGALGTNYVQNAGVLRGLTVPIRWHVVDRPAFATLGREHFQTETLRFFDSLGAAQLKHPVVLFTGSLQYFAEPFEALREVTDIAEVVALDRVLTSPLPDHAVFVQQPNPDEYYAARYPVRCFSSDRLVAWFNQRGFSLVNRFTDNPRRHFDHGGMLFARFK